MANMATRTYDEDVEDIDCKNLKFQKLKNNYQALERLEFSKKFESHIAIINKLMLFSLYIPLFRVIS